MDFDCRNTRAKVLEAGVKMGQRLKHNGGFLFETHRMYLQISDGMKYVQFSV
jgi:hypothetical protein